MRTCIPWRGQDAPIRGPSRLGVRRGLLALLAIGLLLGAIALPKGTGKPEQRASEMVGYVLDFSKPDWIILVNEDGVAVDKNTLYAFQTSKGMKKASQSDVVVGAHVRITIGGKGVAVRVIILEE